MSQKPDSNAKPPTIPPSINSRDLLVAENLVVKGQLIQVGSNTVEFNNLTVNNLLTANTFTDGTITITGGVISDLPDPINNNDAANKAYVDSSVGSGITTLNTLTATTQLFATASSGTDFAINSSGSTHTFDIPSSGAAYMY